MTKEQRQALERLAKKSSHVFSAHGGIGVKVLGIRVLSKGGIIKQQLGEFPNQKKDVS